MNLGLLKAVTAVQGGMDITRAATVYRVKVLAIRDAMESRSRDAWGHSSLETFVHRNSFANAQRAIDQYRGEL